MTAYTAPLVGDTHRWTAECAAAGHPRWDDEHCWCRNPDAPARLTASEPAETVIRGGFFRNRL